MTRIALTTRVLVTLFLLGSCTAHAAPGDIYVELMASPVSWANWSPGHAFLCVAMHLNSGIKEECLGFYPKEGGAKAFIGAPGITESEFKKNPTRFSQVTVSFTRQLSEPQRASIYKLANEWNAKQYALATSNCIGFVHAVVGSIGMQRPDPALFQTPDKYLQKLKDLNP